MIAWTLAAVLIGGAGVFASVVSPPKSVALLQAKNRVKTKIEVDESAVDTADTTGARSPASAAPQFSALAIDDKGTQAIDFTLPCDGNGRFSPNVVQVRLTGKLCEKAGFKGDLTANGEIETSEIRNITNGFSATVFYPGSKANAFTTDYITLASGDNHIRIQHILKSGAKVQRDFMIERN
jgi:hypothetical protein